MYDLNIIYILLYIISIFIVYNSKSNNSKQQDQIMYTIKTYYDNYINVNILTQMLFEPFVRFGRFVFPIIDNILDVLRSYVTTSYTGHYILHIEILLAFILVVLKFTMFNTVFQHVLSLSRLNMKNYMDIMFTLLFVIIVGIIITTLARKLDKYNKELKEKGDENSKKIPVKILVIVQVVMICFYFSYMYVYLQYGNSRSKPNIPLLKYLQNNIINIQYIIDIIYVHLVLSTIILLFLLYIYEIDTSTNRKNNKIILRKDMVLSLAIYAFFVSFVCYKKTNTESE